MPSWREHVYILVTTSIFMNGREIIKIFVLPNGEKIYIYKNEEGEKNE